METKGCSPSVVTYTSMIHGLCAMQVLEDMMGKGIAPNVFTYSTLVDGFCKAGHSLQARDLLEVAFGVKPCELPLAWDSMVVGVGGPHYAVMCLSLARNSQDLCNGPSLWLANIVILALSLSDFPSRAQRLRQHSFLSSISMGSHNLSKRVLRSPPQLMWDLTIHPPSGPNVFTSTRSSLQSL
ncbi:Pentatricopeptide repeat-containing protein, partial [Cucurbita argyrosperma subsp. argyrosperma]